jgi:simple sugar transport system permease protein
MTHSQLQPTQPGDPQDIVELIKDERVKEMPAWRKALIRPELGAICGTILVFAFFLVVASGTGMFAPQGIMNWGIVSAQFVIIAVGACLLMIAGEFDLSVGSMIGFAGIVIALMSVTWGYPVWFAIIVAFLIALAIGALNGYLVIKTGLPSFIVTLAFLFVLRGLTIYGAIATTRQTIIGGVAEVAQGDPLAWLFGGKIGGSFFAWLADIGLIEKYVAGPKAGQPWSTASRC